MKNKNLYLKLIGVLTKKGNKKKASAILNKGLEEAFYKTKVHPSVILVRAFSCLHSLSEIKKIKFRKREHIIPFPISLNREKFLKIK